MNHFGVSTGAGGSVEPRPGTSGGLGSNYMYNYDYIYKYIIWYGAFYDKTGLVDLCIK